MANMVMTVLEAHIPPEKTTAFVQNYEQRVASRPPQIVQNYMVRSADDPTLWRLIALWRSREAFDEYRQSVETTGGILLFREVGAEPTMALYEVMGHWTGTGAIGS